MNTVKHCHWLVALALMLAALPAAALGVPPEPGGSAQSSGIESLAGSFVYSNPPMGGDDCFVRGAVQEFCFTAVSITDDFQYAYTLWLRFPPDWTIGDVYVLGQPGCQSGGTFGTFAWDDYPPGEIRIEHHRLHANPSDRCEATYCVQVTSGSPSMGIGSALVSWYWGGEVYGAPPHFPCSMDGYTPGYVNPAETCDDWSAALAVVARCPAVHLPIVLRAY